MQLIAIKRAFYDNRLLEKGQAFDFAGQKVPSWAREPGEAQKVIASEQAAPPLNGDLKPKAAQAAVRKKAAGLAGE